MTRPARLPDRALWRLIAGTLCIAIAAATYTAHQLAPDNTHLDRTTHQEP